MANKDILDWLTDAYCKVSGPESRGMPKWSCTDCDWWGRVDPPETPKYYCKECGAKTRPNIDPNSLADVETKSDKV